MNLDPLAKCIVATDYSRAVILLVVVLLLIIVITDMILLLPDGEE